MTIARKVLPDGRIVEVLRMLYNLRIVVTLPENDGISYENAWCYKSQAAALGAFEAWDGEGEPPGWNKHPSTGRWREDGTPASEINQWR